MATELREQDLYLIYLTERGVKKRYGDKDEGYIRDVVIPRVKKEIEVITSLGWSDYFLILADIMDYCRSNDIPVGPARGSAGGSVVSYCLEITDVDPLEFDLIFERFLNPERNSPPDIDVDLCWNRRQEVLAYVYKKYGEDRVAQIVTFGTLSAKSLLDDLGRVYRIPKEDIAELKRIIDSLDDGDKITYDKLVDEPAFINKIHELEKRDSRVVEALAKLEGLHRHTSIHAGGVIIANQPMHNLAPTFRPSRKEKRTAVQYEMTDAEAVGLLKMDLLGLKTITLIDWAEKDVRRLADPNFYTRGYRLDDQKAFDIINQGRTAGIFQLEGTGITRFAQEMHIESFNDIVALLALYRPGPLDSGAAQQYIDRKNGREEVRYPHPDLEPILKDTYGIITYQEQVMWTLQIMANYSLGQADIVRRAMGKKDDKLMQEELDKFKRASLATGRYSIDVIEEVAHLIETFARYGFNKSHGVAYAYLTYWTAVLKARYPAIFYSAWLNTVSDRDKMGWIIEMMTREGVRILPPDINKSGERFTPTDLNTVRFGLSAVKGMGKSFVKAVISNRETYGPFSSYINFCQRLGSIPVDKKEALIGAGAFDFEQESNPFAHRGFLLEHARSLNEYAKAVVDKPDKKMPDLYYVDELTDLQKGELEKEYVSFYLTADPLKIVQDELRMMGAQVGVRTEDLVGTPLIGGRVTQVHAFNTRKGQEMGFVDIDDGIESRTVTFFPKEWEKFKAIMQDDKFVVVRCRVDRYRGKKTLNAEDAEEIILEERKADILLDIGKPTPLQIAELKSIIDQEPRGNSRLWIKVRSDTHQFLLKTSVYVEPRQDLIDKLAERYGENAVALRGGV